MNAVIQLYWEPANRAMDYVINVNGESYSTTETSIEVSLPENTAVSAEVFGRNNAGNGSPAYLSFQTPVYTDYPPDAVNNLSWSFVRWDA